MRYRDALRDAMTMLSSDPRTVFLGQAVSCQGTYMNSTFSGVPADKLIEFPVAEETQLGASIGLALAGFVPVSVFPRWNFLLCAANQMVNHVDVLQPRLIIRVGVGSTTPLDPGPQHKGDLTNAFQAMMPNTHFERIHEPADAAAAYAGALRRKGPSVIVEFADLY